MLSQIDWQHKTCRNGLHGRWKWGAGCNVEKDLLFFNKPKTPAFLKKTFLVFFKNKQVSVLFLGKQKNNVNYFYCIIEYHHFQSCTIITCYTYYGIQK